MNYSCPMTNGEPLVEWARRAALAADRVRLARQAAAARQGISLERPPRKMNDISTWGTECGRGIRYADTGAPVASGTKGQVHKISTGRKARGMASDNYATRGENGGN